MGDTVTLLELARMVVILRKDPSSQTAAAMEGWGHPLSREGWMLADLIDTTGAASAGKKWKTYEGRPLKPKDGRKKWGNTGGRTRPEVVAILNARGHNLPA